MTKPCKTLLPFQVLLLPLWLCAPLGELLIVGAGQDGTAKNTPRGKITNNPNNDKYSSLLVLLVPLS